MELSLFSRDVIALATAVALSHNMFDAALCLGICDKIVPGLLIGALQVQPSAGDLRPGRTRCRRACPTTRRRACASSTRKGKVGRDALLGRGDEVVPQPGHLHVLRHRQQQSDADGGDGAAPAGRRVRQSEHAAARCADRRGGDARGRDQRARTPSTRRSATSSTSVPSPTASSACLRPAARPITRSTSSRWPRRRHPDQLGRLQRAVDVVPLLARIYPNGKADVNQFHAAGGMGYVIGELIDAGLLHADVTTVAGDGGLHRYRQEPCLAGRKARVARLRRGSAAIRRSSQPAAKPFSAGRRSEAARRQSRPRGDQDLGSEARAPGRAGAGDRVRIPGASDGGLRSRRIEARFRRGRSLPGAARQRHAGAAQAHADARRAAGPGLSCRIGDRRPHVGCVGQGARGDPCHARVPGRRPACARCEPATRSCSTAIGDASQALVPEAEWNARTAPSVPTCASTITGSAASSSAAFAPTRSAPSRAR